MAIGRLAIKGAAYTGIFFKNIGRRIGQEVAKEAKAIGRIIPDAIEDAKRVSTSLTPNLELQKVMIREGKKVGTALGRAAVPLIIVGGVKLAASSGIINVRSYNRKGKTVKSYRRSK